MATKTKYLWEKSHQAQAKFFNKLLKELDQCSNLLGLSIIQELFSTNSFMFHYEQVTILLTSRCIIFIVKKYFVLLKKWNKKKSAEDSLIDKYFISESTESEVEVTSKLRQLWLYKLTLLSVHVAMVTNNLTDLVSKVWMTHQLVHRCCYLCYNYYKLLIQTRCLKFQWTQEILYTIKQPLYVTHVFVTNYESPAI